MNDPVAELAQIVPDGWLVGGTVRDRVLGRETADFDVATAGSAAEVARALGRAAGGFAFELSEAFGAWRIVAHDRTWQVDILPLNGATIEEDLSRRDLTINAIAAPLGSVGYVNPFGGLEDLGARRLRAVSPGAFERDPLRTLRLARLACELGFDVEAATQGLARAAAPRLAEVAPERVFAELRRVVCAPAALAGLELMDAIGVTDVVAARAGGAARGRAEPLSPPRRVRSHPLGARGGDRARTRSPSGWPATHAPALMRFLGEPLANDLTRSQALRFGALLHDIAKPQTRAVTPQGRVTFMGHDELGARLATEILGRLRTSERLRDHVAALTRHHLRLGFLVHEMPLSRRAVYDYLRATAPVAVDVTVLSVADRLATRGDNAERAIASHLELARQMLAEGLAWIADPPRPPVRGDELAHALGIKPGPMVGDLLAELEAASFSGEVATREEAIARARELIASGPGSELGGRGRAGRVLQAKLAAMSDRDPDCLFCKIVAGEIPSERVDEDERTVAFMDINPATRGHALVIPRRHAANLLEIDAEDLAATVAAAQRLARTASERLGADGVNLLNSCGPAAWQTVFHFHVHVIPRYEGDPLRLPWTPSPGDPDEIAAAAQQLR